MTDNTKNSGGVVYGNGTQVRRLWFMGPNGWVPLPTGGGMDENIRSVNVLNGNPNQWMQVCYGGGAKNIGHDNALSALTVRLPVVVSWPNTGENPLFKDRLTQGQTWNNFAFHTGVQARWLPLTFIKPRVDPTWRIISLYGPFPDAISSGPVTRIPQTPLSFFYPRGGGLDTVILQDNTTLETETTTGRYSLTAGSITDWNFATPGDALCIFEASHGDPSFGEGLNRDHLFASAIDFKVIRRKLKEYYPDSDPYYNGCYDDMSLMGVRRVYVTATIACFAFVNQHHHDGSSQLNQAATAGIRFRIFAQTNAPTDASTVDPVLEAQSVEYKVQSPLDFTASGQVIFDFTAPAGGMDENGMTLTGETFTFEDPGENNLTFVPVVENIPTTDSLNNGVTVNFKFWATQINIHYAEPQQDTPASLHNPSITTRDVA
jgi:hypothetical protein